MSVKDRLIVSGTAEEISAVKVYLGSLFPDLSFYKKTHPSGCIQLYAKYTLYPLASVVDRAYAFLVGYNWDRP
jgi:hypothetical protein